MCLKWGRVRKDRGVTMAVQYPGGTALGVPMWGLVVLSSLVDCWLSIDYLLTIDLVILMFVFQMCYRQARMTFASCCGLRERRFPNNSLVPRYQLAEKLRLRITTDP